MVLDALALSWAVWYGFSSLAEAQFFIALKDGKIAGRVAAIINRLEIDVQKVPRMRFGWIDFIDDLDVSKALLDKILEIGKKENLEFIEGPLGLSNLDKVGVLTEGFDSLSTMITWYNYPYYIEHYKKHGLVKSQKFIENEMTIRFDYFALTFKLYEKSN